MSGQVVTGILPKELWIEKRINNLEEVIKNLVTNGMDENSDYIKNLKEELAILDIQYKSATRIGTFDMDMLKQGTLLKLAKWDGYWMYDKEKDTIMIHCKDGQIVDIRETEDLEFTINNILARTWEIATPRNCKVLRKEQKLCK